MPAASALDDAYREGRSARTELIGDLAREQEIADGGAPPPASFARSAAQLGRLIAGDPRIRLAFVALGGWDTHVDQGGATGWLANRLRPLGDGLAALAGGLGGVWRDTVVVGVVGIRPHRPRKWRPRHRSRPRQRDLARRRCRPRRPGLRRLAGAGAGDSSISAGTSRSRPISARRCRRSSGLTWVSPNTSSRRYFREHRRRRPGSAGCWRRDLPRGSRIYRILHRFFTRLADDRQYRAGCVRLVGIGGLAGMRQ